MSITSKNFSVDKDGNTTMANANITGGNINVSSPSETIAQVKVYNGSDNTSYTEISPIGFNRCIDNKRVIGTNSVLEIINGSLKTTSSQLIIESTTNNLISKLGNGKISLLRDNSEITTVATDSIKTPILTQTSLEENKKNFEKLDNDTALQIILNTDIYKYNLKNQADGDKKHIGFVIGDNYKYSKEITSGNNDGVDSYSMTSASYGAIQKLYSIIEQLQNEIKELKGEK